MSASTMGVTMQDRNGSWSWSLRLGLGAKPQAVPNGNEQSCPRNVILAGVMQAGQQLRATPPQGEARTRAACVADSP